MFLNRGRTGAGDKAADHVRCQNDAFSREECEQSA